MVSHIKAPKELEPPWRGSEHEVSLRYMLAHVLALYYFEYFYDSLLTLPCFALVGRDSD